MPPFTNESPFFCVTDQYARVFRGRWAGPPACVPPVVPQSSIATPLCPAGPPTMVRWPYSSNPAAAVDRCFFLAARRVLSFGAPRDASVNSPNISRNTASMRTRSPVASSQVAARASRPTRAWRDCPHTRVETRRRQTCSNGGDQIAYEPLQESGELFGVLKCKPVDSEAESPEFPILGEDQVLHAHNSRFRRLPDSDIARAKSRCCRTRISANPALLCDVNFSTASTSDR